MSERKPKILTLVSHYLPGFQAGGPIVSVSNLIDELSVEFDFSVVTRDRDLHDREPYPQYLGGQWQEISSAQVYYVSPKELRFDRLCRLISNTPHDVLFLNSFFDTRLSVQPLLARCVGLIPRNKLLIAPRGEFAPSALDIKSWKKTPYLWAARAAHVLDDAVWLASSSLEADNIRSALGAGEWNIEIASDLPSRLPPSASILAGERSQTRPVKVVFLSRISPMKNLDFAIRALGLVEVDVEFDIFGPVEDVEYWACCQSLIATLGPNIKVHYGGAVPPADVSQILGRYDLFFLPSRGENFGHVIIEALSAGTPVLISERTLWTAGGEHSCAVIPLSAGEEAFAGYIELFHSLPAPARRKSREMARTYAENYLQRDNLVEESRKAFRSVLARSLHR